MTEDFQPQIFESFAQELETKFPGIKVSSVITDQPPNFPCVQIEQQDRPTDHDSSGRIRLQLFSCESGCIHPAIPNTAMPERYSIALMKLQKN